MRMMKSGESAASVISRRLLEDDLLSLRLDWLILGGAAAGGAVLVLADVVQRWLSPRHIWALDIDGRFNAETWFHSFILAGAALAAFGLGFTNAGRARRLMWWAVGASFVFMSLDKSISLHERVGQNLEDWQNLPDNAGRVLWEIVYAPFLIALAVLLLLLVRRSGVSTRRLVFVGIVLCAAKVFMEGLMFPAIDRGLFSEESVIAGIEANVEESIQLLGFAAFFAALAQLLIERVVLAARGELEAADAAAVEHPAIDVRLILGDGRAPPYTLRPR